MYNDDFYVITKDIYIYDNYGNKRAVFIVDGGGTLEQDDYYDDEDNNYH